MNLTNRPPPFKSYIAFLRLRWQPAPGVIYFYYDLIKPSFDFCLSFTSDMILTASLDGATHSKHGTLEKLAVPAARPATGTCSAPSQRIRSLPPSKTETQPMDKSLQRGTV